MINKVILIGHVGKDPEIRTVGDSQVASFTMATSESYKNKQGERVTNTEWHNIVVWRGLAKVVEQYVKKGSMISIEGKITNRSYEKDGQTKYFTEIVASDLKLFPKGQSSTQPTGPSDSNDDSGDEVDDLPF